MVLKSILCVVKNNFEKKLLRTVEHKNYFLIFIVAVGGSLRISKPIFTKLFVLDCT